jgi:hypothetical protein
MSARHSQASATAPRRRDRRRNAPPSSPAQATVRGGSRAWSRLGTPAVTDARHPVPCGCGQVRRFPAWIQIGALVVVSSLPPLVAGGLVTRDEEIGRLPATRRQTARCSIGRETIACCSRPVLMGEQELFQVARELTDDEFVSLGRARPGHPSCRTELLALLTLRAGGSDMPERHISMPCIRRRTWTPGRRGLMRRT